MVTIVQKGDPILRKTAKAVTKSMFGKPELKRIIRDMKKAIDSQDDAVAIAAPQIGVSLRIFVVAGKIFEMLGQEKNGERKNKTDDVVFINPEVIKLSRDKKEVEEGCLSVRYLYGKVKRSKKARVRALNEKGRPFEMGGTGLLAQIFQHETDHLVGKLFIDSATEIENLPPEKI